MTAQYEKKKADAREAKRLEKVKRKETNVKPKASEEMLDFDKLGYDSSCDEDEEEEEDKLPEKWSKRSRIDRLICSNGLRMR